MLNIQVNKLEPVDATATLVTASCEPPTAALFVSVTAPMPLRQAKVAGVQVGKVIVSGLGATVAVASAVTAVPVRLTTAFVTVAPV